MTQEFFRRLAREAAERYPARDRFGRGFARGKLSGDPAFRYLLEQGLVPPGARILDLGAGQGVLAALLAAVTACADWPPGWPAAPRGTRVRGIEIARRDVERARAAATGMEIVQGDIRTAPFGEADVCVLLDVLHYLDREAQDQVLARVRGALERGGVLILRVADPEMGMRFHVTHAADRLGMALRGRFFVRHCHRPLPAWRDALAALGFDVEIAPMSEGTPFANFLLVARYHP